MSHVPPPESQRPAALPAGHSVESTEEPAGKDGGQASGSGCCPDAAPAAGLQPQG